MKLDLYQTMVLRLLATILELLVILVFEPSRQYKLNNLHRWRRLQDDAMESSLNGEIN